MACWHGKGYETNVTAKRLGYVDGLRALAALAVVVDHVTLEIWPVGLPQRIAPFVDPAVYGHTAVSVFIVLSGFSLMLPVARNGFRLPDGALGFFWRRAKRILPPYYYALTLSLLLIWLFIGRKTGTHWDVSIPVTAQGVVTHVLLVQDFSATTGSMINHVFWSIALECQIYLLFPALVWLWRRYHPLFVTLMTLVVSVVGFVALLATSVGHEPGYGISAFDPQYLGLFALGMLAATIYTMPTPFWSALARWRIWDVLALGGFVLLLSRSHVETLFGWLALDALTGLMTVGLLLAASHHSRANPIRAALEWRPLVWIGGFSYSLYLIHAPLIQVIWQYALRPLRLSDTTTYLLLLGVGAPLIVAAAWVFWRLCERPFLNTRPASEGVVATGHTQVAGQPTQVQTLEM
ncbi:MAG TPA: acyltransferase [Ktedonobacterales bacterium]|nr:acyltransferase [Ktedonobacterales bacterium]